MAWAVAETHAMSASPRSSPTRAALSGTNVPLRCGSLSRKPEIKHRHYRQEASALGPQGAEHQHEGDVVEADRRAVLLSAFAVLLAPYLVDNSGLAALAASPAITTVFVAGATGATGRRVVQQLRARGLKVRAGCRDLAKAQGLGLALDSSVTLVLADVTRDKQQLVDAIGDAQAVVCATGYTGFNPAGFGQVDETGTEQLVDAARAAGATRFVLMSSLLTNARAVGQSDNPAFKFLNLFGGVLDHKHAAELYLKDSGLDYTIVRPGGLTDKPASETGALIVGNEDTLFGLPTELGGPISRDTVAEVMVAALLQPQASRRVVEIQASPAAPVLAEDVWFSG